MTDLTLVDIREHVLTSIEDINKSFNPLPFLQKITSNLRTATRSPLSNTLLNNWLDKASEQNSIEQASIFIEASKQIAGYKKFAIIGFTTLTLNTMPNKMSYPSAWYSLSIDVFTQIKNNLVTGKILVSVYQNVSDLNKIKDIQVKPSRVFTISQVHEYPSMFSTTANLSIPEVNTFFRHVVENSPALIGITLPSYMVMEQTSAVCISPSASWVSVVNPPWSILKNTLYTPVGWINMKNIGFTDTLDVLYKEDWKKLLRLTGIRIPPGGVNGPETNGIFDWSTPKAKLILAELTRMSIKSLNDTGDRNRN